MNSTNRGVVVEQGERLGPGTERRRQLAGGPGAAPDGVQDQPGDASGRFRHPAVVVAGRQQGTHRPPRAVGAVEQCGGRAGVLGVAGRLQE
ncbi:hypothetical protein E2C11_04775 [Streptomyces lavendulae]|nr:hypothetical protein [Streptomyces lavendulae]TXJ85225.1 hypothetical protein E2C11_04775 [Streptomyces lavendulae]